VLWGRSYPHQRSPSLTRKSSSGWMSRWTPPRAPLLAPPRVRVNPSPHCCNTFARLLRSIRPPLDLPFVCHTLYNIDNNDIVETPTPPQDGCRDGLRPSWHSWRRRGGVEGVRVNPQSWVKGSPLTLNPRANPLTR